MPKKKMTSRRKTVDKWKKKKWFSIKASKLFDGKILAETPAEKPTQLVGRTLKITLDKLTNQRNKRDTTISFKVNNVQGQNALTRISSFEVAKASLGRTIRRRNSKIAVFEKIGVVGGSARITLVTITSRKASNPQKTGIRKLMKERIKKLEGKDFEDVVKELLMGKITTETYKDAGKVCNTKKVIAYKASFTESK